MTPLYQKYAQLVLLLPTSQIYKNLLDYFATRLEAVSQDAQERDFSNLSLNL
jgi:hypothetical protein